MEDVEDPPYRPSEEKVKTKTILAFGTIGFLVDMFFYVNLSAGQDILQGTVIPTPFVLLSATGPACLSSMLYPYIFQKIPVPVASCVILALSVAGMLGTTGTGVGTFLAPLSYLGKLSLKQRICFW